jgi:hypothetical protein
MSYPHVCHIRLLGGNVISLVQKRMTTENKANAILLSVALFLSAALPAIFQDNFWFGIIAVAAVVVVVSVREILP